MQPFSYYRGDVKRPYELELTALTAISGSNQTGKTGIASGVRLALTGAHPTLGKKAGMLARLIPHGALRAEAVLQGPEGNAEFSVSRTTSGKHATALAFTGALEMYDKRRDAIIVSDVAAAMMAGHTARGREELLRRFGKDTKVSLEAPEGLSEDQVKIWAEAVAVATRELRDGSSAEILGGVTAWCRTAASAARSKVKSLSAQTQGIVAAKTRPVSGKSEKELVVELAEHDAYEAQSGDRHALAAAEAELAKYGGAAPTGAPVEQSRAALEEARRRSGRSDAFVSLTEELAKLHKPDCPLCATQALPPKRWSERLVVLQPLQAARRKAEAEAVIALDAAQAREVWHAAKAKAEKDVARRRAAVTAPKPVRARDDVVEDLSALRAATALASKAYAQRGATKAEEQRVLDLAVVADMAASCQVQALVQCREAALERVNAFMPPGLRAALEIDEDAVVWGVQPDGAAEMSAAGAGSGFEEGSLMVALGAATATTDLRVVVLDDDYLGRFDARRILDFMRVLERAVERGALTQAFLFWNRPHELLEAKAWRHQVLLDP